jgi:hypothetical protein
MSNAKNSKIIIEGKATRQMPEKRFWGESVPWPRIREWPNF